MVLSTFGDTLGQSLKTGGCLIRVASCTDFTVQISAECILCYDVLPDAE